MDHPGGGQFEDISSLDTVVEYHKNVSFNIASEASYIYILSGQKFIKNAKIGKLKCDIFGDFQTPCLKLKGSSNSSCSLMMTIITTQLLDMKQKYMTNVQLRPVWQKSPILMKVTIED